MSEPIDSKKTVNSSDRKKVITFGTFDLLHDGHLNILRRARGRGDYLIVGVSSDVLNSAKGKSSIFPEKQRANYIKSLKFVDEVFLEESLEKKDEYIKKTGANLLVMGDDWKGKFDWVSCDVEYFPRTEGISSTLVKESIFKRFEKNILLFGDTRIPKHYDCATSMVNELVSANLIPIFTTDKFLPKGIKCDALVYFNLPNSLPIKEYDDVPRILIDHGASHLKWFLANKKRYGFFDLILTAGSDHTRSLAAFFSDERKPATQKGVPAGFIKAKDILSPPKISRIDICATYKLNPRKPIILLAPTWHITANKDMQEAIDTVASIDNHIVSLHPETRHIDISEVNLADASDGITLELIKHADVVISDTSSTIYEAAAIKKKCVQILLREYSDNNAVFFDFPYSAGTAELFCGGIPTRVPELLETVEKLVAGEPVLLRVLDKCQNRVLQGTTIDKRSCENLVTELKKAISGKTLRRCDHKKISLNTVYQQNLRFAKNTLIAHGAGDYRGLHASNSKEAIVAAKKFVDFIELDFVKGKDGTLVAHDGMEKYYSINGPFSDVTCKEFSAKKFKDKLSTISVHDAIKSICGAHKYLVCDIKSTNKDFIDVANNIWAVAKKQNLESYLVFQCYCVKDFKSITKAFPETKTLLAVWKYFYKDPLGAKTHEFLSTCLNINPDSVIGISVPYYNHHMERPSIDDLQLQEFQSYWKRVYIHGAPLERYADIQRSNFGVFADGCSREFEFKDAPDNFNWLDYLFLNPGLVTAGCDTQLAATLHYLKYGKVEGRLSAYDVPDNFLYSEYLNKNPELRLGGISGPNSAKAHYTKYGRDEGREF